MITRRLSLTLLPVVLSAGLIFGGCSDVALASWYGDHEAKEIKALNTAKTSAGQAINIAQSQTGGRAMRVTFDREHGRYLYRIKTLEAGGKVMWVLVDAMTGKIVGMHQEGVINRLTDREDRVAFAKLSPSATSLDAAIAAAHKDTGGKVLKAAFRDEDGRQAYDIRIARGDQIHWLQIDPATGNLVKRGNLDE